MDETVVVALITGVLAVVGSYAGNVAISHKKSQQDALKDVERETRQAVKLEAIEKKLDTHNKYAEKLNQLSQDVAVVRNEIEMLRKEIEK